MSNTQIVEYSIYAEMITVVLKPYEILSELKGQQNAQR